LPSSSDSKHPLHEALSSNPSTAKKKKKKERKKRKRKKGGLGRMREWRGGGTNNVYTCK
jgi:hypothetical protein